MELLFAFPELAGDVTWLMDLGEINLRLDLSRGVALTNRRRAGFGREMPPDLFRLVIFNRG